MRRRRTLSSLAVLTAVAVLTSVVSFVPGARAEGRTLYVAPWGSDYERDGWTIRANSIETPWRTLLQSFRRLRPGDTLVVRGGTYTEWSVGWGAVRATSSAPIRVQGYPGERAVLKGTMQLVAADYWIISGINVTRDPNRPRSEFLVKFHGGVGWQYLKSEVWGSIGVSNLMITGDSSKGYPRKYRVAYNCIHDNVASGDPLMNDHNIYLYPGYSSGPGVIERNILYGARNGANIKAAGPSSSTGAAYVTIRYNTMARAGTGVIVGYKTHHVSMVRNLIGQRYGGSSSYDAAMVGNHVTGYADKAGYNAVWGYAKTIRNTNSSTTGIVNTGGNVWASPGFDSMYSCQGFHPSNATAKRYGRYAL